MPEKKSYKRPAMRKLGQGYTYYTLSSSDPTTRHMTVVLNEPLIMQSGTFDVVCSCKGWTRHKHCWHADEAFEQAEVFVDPVRTDLETALWMLVEYVDEDVIHGDTRLSDLLQKYSDKPYCAFCGDPIEAEVQMCSVVRGECKP